MINLISHGITTRYPNNNFLINKLNKTTSGGYFQIIGRKIFNNLSSDILNFPLGLLKTKCLYGYYVFINYVFVYLLSYFAIFAIFIIYRKY
jgi:hypothetical protein